MKESHLQKATALLESIRGQSLENEKRQNLAIELAAHMLRAALSIQTFAEKRQQAELARMMRDPRGKAFTMSMTDQCFRSHRSKRVASQLIHLLEMFGIPRYVGLIKKVQLTLFKWLGNSFHFFLVPIATMALRKATSKVILPGERGALSHHMEKRRKQGVRLNLNHLGEAILGEDEAVSRLNVYLNDLEQDDIEYVSIKISTIFSQIDHLAWDRTVDILAERLRMLYRRARDNKFIRADGGEVTKFVNLDMEEYRDLHLTKELFMKVLDEEEFLSFSAGIVLQAYIPDSSLIQKELTEWAMKRMARGGAPIKIRIVKGANLAMEQVESSTHTLAQPPFKKKSETDANYKRMVTYGCQKEHAEAVHLGIASHNLFDVAYALLLRTERELEKEVSFEMLEGMADHIRRTVQDLTHDMLLYCPVATKEDFQSAIAYLIRRLDENTGPENFLRHSFGLKPGTPDWDEQVALFKTACAEMEDVQSEPRRMQDRSQPPVHPDLSMPFQNESETDFTLYPNQKWIHDIEETWRAKSFDPIPLVISGQEEEGDIAHGIDPSTSEASYSYNLASSEQVSRALSSAKWEKTTLGQRAELLSSVAKKLRENWGNLMGAMMRDGGKNAHQADPEVTEAIDFAEYYARCLLDYEQMGEVEFSAKGTILVAPPWNFPISIPCGCLCGALAGGNPVIFKPAPEAVLSGWTLVKLFWEAGVPKEALQFINCIDDPVGSELIKDERLSGVILTGGTSTARLFLKMRPTLSLTAETGGKNALIITSMADRDLAIKDLVNSAFGHSGQKCSAASLGILEAELYNDKKFLRQLADAVKSLPVGTCWDHGKVVPLIRPPGETLMKGFTHLDKGEKWLVEPKQDPHNPHLWSPGVKIGVKEGSFMHQNELFGPVLGLMKAKDLDEALRFANGTDYGLTSGIHSLDDREIHKWIKNIKAGNCYVNRGTTGAIVQRQPFGGCKASSFGHGSKAGGPNYLFQFMDKKQVALPKQKDPVPDSVNALNLLLSKIDLSDEDHGIWFASIANYAHWGRRFARDEDKTKLVGQDNLLRYVPRENMALRIQETDKPIDIFRALAAALTCKTHLEISYDPSKCPLPIDETWPQILSWFPFKPESDEEFAARLNWKTFERVRFLSIPEDSYYKTAAESGTYLSAEPVLASGRIELTHYVREVALSVDYHRYGNLGVREGEMRSEVL